MHVYRKLTNVAENVKKVVSNNLKKPKVAENSKSCRKSQKLPSNLWLSLSKMVVILVSKL